LNEQEIKEKINAIFEKHKHQQKVLVDIYKLFIPNWDDIDKIENWPTCGKAMWIWISNKFADFDSKYHPEVCKGGGWINNGFSSNSKLADWEVDLKSCKIVFII